MLFTIGTILLFGYLAGKLFSRLKLPSLTGMILVGIVLSYLGLIDDTTLSISSDLRRLALVVILTRAGLTLNVSDLKKSGRPAILMCFLPATFEIIGCILILPILFDVSILEATLIGTVVSAVSPAVVVPRMIHCINHKYGTDKGIPQMILAGASADDVYVIVLFTSVCTALQSGNFSAVTLLKIPISIVLGISLGLLSGYVLNAIFKKFNIQDTEKMLILLSVSFGMLKLEDTLTGIVCVSGLLAIMSMNLTIRYNSPVQAKSLSEKFNSLWVFAEVLLFVLVGVAVNLDYVKDCGLLALVCISIALLFRMFGVLLCTLGTNLSKKERLFCMVSYCPKATVQAGIGAVPLAMGLSCGNVVLTFAVVSILFTATLGAILIDNTYKKLLTQER